VFEVLAQGAAHPPDNQTGQLPSPIVAGFAWLHRFFPVSVQVWPHWKIAFPGLKCQGSTRTGSNMESLPWPAAYSVMPPVSRPFRGGWFRF